MALPAAMRNESGRELKALKTVIWEMWWLINSAPDCWGRGPGFDLASPTLILERYRITV